MKRHIKQGLLLLALLSLMLAVGACGRGANQDNTNDTTNGMVAGISGQVTYAYIREINGQARTVTLDQVELVNREDTARVSRLGLKDGDPMYEDFYIYNSRVQQRMYPLADNLVFDLADSENDRTTGTSQNRTETTQETQNMTGTDTGRSDNQTEEDQKADHILEWGAGSNAPSSMENRDGQMGTTNLSGSDTVESTSRAGVLGEHWPWLDDSYDNAVTSITKGNHEDTPTLFAVTISNGEVVRISRVR